MSGLLSSQAEVVPTTRCQARGYGSLVGRNEARGRVSSWTPSPVKMSGKNWFNYFIGPCRMYKFQINPDSTFQDVICMEYFFLSNLYGIFDSSKVFGLTQRLYMGQQKLVTKFFSSPIRRYIVQNRRYNIQVHNRSIC